METKETEKRVRGFAGLMAKIMEPLNEDPRFTENFKNVKKKFLVKKKDLIKPSFATENVSVPVGFYPSTKVFLDEEPKEIKEETDLLSKIVKRISENLNAKEQDILNKIKKIEEERNITTEVAALLFGKENNLDLTDFFEEIENKIFT